jgi:peptidyl-prolyl cis-trans isomerase B (cyclophilin B)
LKKIVIIIAISLLLVSVGNQAFAQSDEKLVVLETNLGVITIEFFPNDAPNHVKNFISLTKSGFYEGTIFHRIIPGFMIQGGDPNTINGDLSTWGQGGPEKNLNSEFNTIKHERGIVSMARANDPNSAGSQFFIVHKASNYLDGQYTVFGRIVTEQSFETLDKIAALETNGSTPINPENVRITNATVVERSEISNLMDLSEPERTISDYVQPPENQIYESGEHKIKLSFPSGWLLQEPKKSDSNAPDIVAVGPQTGNFPAVISLLIEESEEKTFEELIEEKHQTLEEVVLDGSLEIISTEKSTVFENPAYEIIAIGYFEREGEYFDVKFKEVLIYDEKRFFTITYSNDVNVFNSQLPIFKQSLDTFEILTVDPELEGGGCLIATATYGSEMALEVQQLRELRDNTLLQTESGTSFMSTFNDVYYSFSPIIADYERENPVFKEVVKLAITPMINSLSILNYVDMDSESSVLGYGISLILLNLGMYLGIPIFGILKMYQFRKN